MAPPVTVYSGALERAWPGIANSEVGGGGYQDTDIGQVIVLAYLDAYIKMVTQMGGLPTNPSAAAPRAQ